MDENQKAATLQEAKRKLAEAKTAVVYEHRFFGYGMLRMRWEWDWELRDPVGNKPTMATDGKRIIVNPEFVIEHAVPQLTGTTIHEIQHGYLEHPRRILELVKAHRGRAPTDTLFTIGNIAADVVVNHHCGLTNAELPPSCIPGEPNVTLEQKFQQLLVEYEDAKQDADQGDQGDQEGEGGSGSSNSLMEQLAGQKEMHGTVIELKKEDGSEMTEGEWRGGGTKLRGIIEAAMREAKKAGQMPGELETFFKKKMKARVPWQDVLSRFVGSHNREDYSYRRLNRRGNATGVILPGLWNPTPAKLLFAPDTSGSMYGAPLDQVGAELFSVSELYTSDPELTILWWDANVYPQVVQSPEEMEPKGGGGTSTAALFKYVAEHHADAEGVVVLTDGYIWNIGEEPPCEVLWIVVGANDEFTPAFGEVAYFIP